MNDHDRRFSVLYLAGSSYPAGQNIERNLAAGLDGRIARFLTQEEVVDRCGRAALSNLVAERMAAVAPLIEEMTAAGERVVLAGRSSGARAATRYAAEAPPAQAPAAVLGIGYPFRAPGRPDDPDRYAHLATLSIPTLILHGRTDPYGDDTVVGRCPLSPAIAFHWIDTDHEFRLTPEGWNAAIAVIAAFLRRLP